MIFAFFGTLITMVCYIALIGNISGADAKIQWQGFLIGLLAWGLLGTMIGAILDKLNAR